MRKGVDAMKPLKRPALVVGLILLAVGCSVATEPTASGEPETAATAPSEPTELDANGVAERLAAGEDIFLLDVRTAEELEQDGLIEGSTHIPIDELQARMEEVPKDKPIVAY